jgi:hypothetical protein
LHPKALTNDPSNDTEKRYFIVQTDSWSDSVCGYMIGGTNQQLSMFWMGWLSDKNSISLVHSYREPWEGNDGS